MSNQNSEENANSRAEPSEAESSSDDSIDINMIDDDDKKSKNTAFLTKRKTREGSVKLRRIQYNECEKSDNTDEWKIEENKEVVVEQPKITKFDNNTVPRNFYTPRPPGIPDNYVWDDFLIHMVSKNSFPRLIYSELVGETTEITYVIGNVALLLSLYYRLKNNLMASETAIVMILIATVAFYFAFWRKKMKEISRSKYIKDIKTLIVIILSLLIFSPLINSLTKSITNNSLIVLAHIFIILHICLYDYTISKSDQKIKLTQNRRFLLSLNWIFFAAILLSSRFSDQSQVFTILLFTATLFGYSPFIRKKHQGAAFLYFLVNAYFLAGIHPMAVFAYAFILFIVCCACPLIFIYAYSYKNDVHGPWDLPVVKQIKL